MREARTEGRVTFTSSEEDESVRGSSSPGAAVDGAFDLACS